MDRLATRKAIAFARALFRETGADATVVSRLHPIIQADEAASSAAKLVDGSSALGITDEGTLALRQLANAYASLYDLQIETKTAFQKLDQALSEVKGGMARDLREASVVTPDQLETSRQFWPAYMNTLCHVIACLYGTEPLRELRNVAVAGTTDISELQDATDSLLSHSSNLEELGCWTISREVGRRTSYLTGMVRFVFDWQPIDLDTLVKLYGLKPLSFGLAGANNSRDTIVLAGRGYVVGTEPLDSLKLRDAGVHTSLPLEALSARGLGLVNPTDPRPALRRYFNDNAYCLHPEALADALDHLAQMRGGAL
ncbi:MAG: hypothetical protein IJ203_13115 [Atopobiaceae bacterium]|nr:hypothetical protein [Atopobiaceae bacterium]